MTWELNYRMAMKRPFCPKDSRRISRQTRQPWNLRLRAGVCKKNRRSIGQNEVQKRLLLMRSDGLRYGRVWYRAIFSWHFPRQFTSKCLRTEVMDHARDIHRDVLVGLISHPGLRIRKDLARYALAEHILKLGYARMMTRRGWNHHEPPWPLVNLDKKRSIVNDNQRSTALTVFNNETFCIILLEASLPVLSCVQTEMRRYTATCVLGFWSVGGDDSRTLLICGCCVWSSGDQHETIWDL
jgi:hypothetical protein